jgi:orotidine-5'-phosphate decarboxylase
VTTGYLERLASRSAAVGSVLCLGIDPDPAALPAGFSRDLRGIEAFARLLLDAAVPFAAAVKPNLAFFEAFGADGMAVLERLRAAVPGDVPVVADAKRGDIGSTAARQAVALFDRLAADAVTVSPYLGQEAIAPLLERRDRFAYVLCRTSNPGAAEIQGLVVEADPETAAPAEPVWARVARRAVAWGPGETVGLVVGATAPAELAAVRQIAPGLAVLVPGVGAQGGDVAVVLEAGPARIPPAGGRPGGGLLVNVSRGIAGAVIGSDSSVDGGGPGGGAGCRSGGGSATGSGGPREDPGERLAAMAAEWAARLPVLSWTAGRPT